MNHELPECPPRDAPQGEWNQYFATMFAFLVGNAQCEAHAKRLRRVELTLAGILGTGGLGVIVAAAKYLLGL